MNKITTYIFIGIIVIVGAFYVFKNEIDNDQQAYLADDPRDGEYLFSGKPVRLVDGISRTPIAEGSASMRTIQYFGNEVVADIDNDGDDDVAFLITDDSGGSGTFFYLAGAIKEDGGYSWTQAMLIGDRIAPQTTEFRDGLIIVNYADRAPGEAMTIQPSIGKSLYVKYDPMDRQFGEVVQNFEGESNL